MNLRPAPRVPAGTGGRWFRSLLVAVALQAAVHVLVPALAAAGPGGPGSVVRTGGLAAQQQEALADSVPVRDLEYRRELAAWEAAVRAVRVAESQLGTAIAMIESAQRTGNSAALEEAQRTAQTRALENQRLDNRVAELADRLDVARERLLSALDARLAVLQARLLSATSVAEEERLDALVQDLENQYREIEEAGDVADLEEPPEYYPAASPDPRDGPTEWRIKAGLLERRAQVVESQIEDARGTLERLDAFLRLQRTRADARASRDRFGDAQPPVSSSVNPGDRTTGLVADTVGIPLDQLPLDQQISVWEAYIEELETFRAQLLAQAALFRGWLNRITARGGGGA